MTGERLAGIPAVAVIIAMLTGSACLAGTGEPAGEDTSLILPATLTKAGHRELFLVDEDCEVGIAFPQLRGYKKDGTPFLAIYGAPPDLEQVIADALVDPQLFREIEPLGSFSKKLDSGDGSAHLFSPPWADITFVVFHADWCPPCKMQLLQLRDYASRQEGRSVRIIKVDADPREIDKEDVRAFSLEALEAARDRCGKQVEEGGPPSGSQP